MNSILGPKPVRQIGIRTRSVSGKFPSIGHYESSLERDLMEIARFDPNIGGFFPQPVIIPYTSPDGQVRTYTPDALIEFVPDMNEPPLLVEVKYREDFRKDWKQLMPKLRAAKAYCLNHGWRFEVLTEREIRTPYLKNARFLWPYIERVPEEAMKAHVLKILGDLIEADPALLLCALCFDPSDRARMIPVLWHLIAVGVIGCDLSKPLTMKSLIWVEERS